jgi:hypothetical protein
VQTDITSKDLRDFEEKRGEPQRFKLPAIGDTATKTGELTCQPILSRHYASMTQYGLQIAGVFEGRGRGCPPLPHSRILSSDRPVGCVTA